MQTRIPRSLMSMAPRSFKARSGLLAAMFLTAAICLPASVQAITTISQGFLTKDKLALGSIVSLQKNTADQVNAASSTNVDTILGVVIGDGNSLLSLSDSDAKTTEVQVATSGIVNVLVSDINGRVFQGDQITASPIAGVGMKATDSIKVVGISQGDMPKDTANKQKFKDKSGQEKTANLSEVPVNVNVSYYFKQPEKTIVPGAVQNVANALAGKQVKPVPIIVSMAIFVLAIVVVCMMIYSMIRSSIISIGRNPMSQSAVYRHVMQMSAIILAVLSVTVASIYMVLTKF